jgi:hypothetical protein
VVVEVIGCPFESDFLLSWTRRTSGGEIDTRRRNSRPAEPGDTENESFCKNVDKQIGGPGGIWLDQKGSVAPPGAKVHLKLRPKH